MEDQIEPKSNLEIVAEFMDQYPEHADTITADNFPVFFEHPAEVIKIFEASKEFLRNAVQIPEEVVRAELAYYLNAACEDVNLNTIDE